MSYRDCIVCEIVETERKYVRDFESLYELKNIIEQRGVISSHAVHDIFLNIDSILEFQQRFLIEIEMTNSQPGTRQEWGKLFANNEEKFSIYMPFIENQRSAVSVAKREFDKIVKTGHPIVSDFNTLDAFLLRPMPRLIKYSLILKVCLSTIDAVQC